MVEANPLSPGAADLDATVPLMREPFFLALPRLIADGVRVDLAFIGGRHLFDHLLLDLFMTDLVLDPGGVVAVDDAHWPGLSRVLLYWERNRAYERLAANTRRLSVFRKTADDHRLLLPNTWAEVGRRFSNF